MQLKIFDARAQETRTNRWELSYPLVDWGITKEDVLTFWKSMPFDLMIAEHEGNCDLCFLKGQSKRARTILSQPSVADWWIEQEMRMGKMFTKGYSVKQFRDKVLNNPASYNYEQQDTDCLCTID
jgi:hypothetical protein